MQVLGTRSFVMKVRSRQGRRGVEKLAIGTKSFMVGERGRKRSAINKPTTLFNSQ